MSDDDITDDSIQNNGIKKKGAEGGESDKDFSDSAEAELFLEMMDSVEEDMARIEEQGMDLGAAECIFLMLAYLKGYCKEVEIDFNEALKNYEAIERELPVPGAALESSCILTLDLNQKDRQLLIDLELAPDALISRMKIAPVKKNGESHFKYSEDELGQLAQFISAESDRSEDMEVAQALDQIFLKIRKILDQHSH
jgi:hypothetical protein